MKLKVLAICVSARTGGNTNFLLDEALEVIDNMPFEIEVTKYSFSGKKFNSCCGCLKCYSNGGECVFRDDFEELRSLWLKADCIIYSMPVYQAGMPGILKVFIDRLGNSLYGYNDISCMRHMKTMCVLAQGGDFPGGQEFCAFDVMRHAAMMDCIYIAPDNSYFGCGGWADGPNGNELRLKKERNTDDIVLTIKNAKCVVKRSVEMAAIIKAGSEIMREYLEEDPYYEELYLEK